jgi:hypothetical protein
LHLGLWGLRAGAAQGGGVPGIVAPQTGDFGGPRGPTRHCVPVLAVHAATREAAGPRPRGTGPGAGARAGRRPPGASAPSGARRAGARNALCGPLSPRPLLRRPPGETASLLVSGPAPCFAAPPAPALALLATRAQPPCAARGCAWFSVQHSGFAGGGGAGWGRAGVRRGHGPGALGEGPCGPTRRRVAPPVFATTRPLVGPWAAGRAAPNRGVRSPRGRRLPGGRPRSRAAALVGCAGFQGAGFSSASGVCGRWVHRVGACRALCGQEEPRGPTRRRVSADTTRLHAAACGAPGRRPPGAGPGRGFPRRAAPAGRAPHAARCGRGLVYRDHRSPRPPCRRLRGRDGLAGRAFCALGVPGFGVQG